MNPLENQLEILQKRIRTLRKRLRLTQTDAARLAGISQAQWSRHEGKSLVRTLELMSDTLEREIDCAPLEGQNKAP